MRNIVKIFRSYCFASIVSAVLLWLAFPPHSLTFCLWFALVPLMMALDRCPPSKGFQIGYLSGFVFFSLVLSWLLCLTQWFSVIAAVGVVALYAYLASYFGLFAWFYSRYRSKTWGFFIAVICFWVMLEYVRAHLFSGFDWASLGYALFKQTRFIQIADITGVYGVSFIILTVNIVWKDWANSIVRIIQEAYKPDQKNEACGCCYKQKLFMCQFLFMLLLLGATALYGQNHLKERLEVLKSGSNPVLHVAVLQGNIPQDKKWQTPFWHQNLETYIQLTREAAQAGPDLIVWPETSLPGIIPNQDFYFQRLKDVVEEIHIPVLCGTVVAYDKQYYNVALYLSAQARVVREYLKVHLVPFGEYVPGRHIFPGIMQLIPIEDFSAGRNHVLFLAPVRHKETWRFAALICFEDTVSSLARSFVSAGADLFINITNDAWFPGTVAPIMHLQGSVFRSVEMRRAMVRSANTGFSGFIDPWGTVTQFVQDASGRSLEIKGYAVDGVLMNRRKSFYAVYGDVFVLFCLALFICFFVSALRGVNKQRTG
ncbi:MAG: apolipoprotein N-acyltransferase [Candidatus Omnitrophica bacterium]|nr:apolipoprotein N-acyltransferase [Candidatus Omnitrophota bacterium]